MQEAVGVVERMKIKLQGKWQKVDLIGRTAKKIVVTNPATSKLYVGQGVFIVPAQTALTFSKRTNGKWILQYMAMHRGLELSVADDDEKEPATGQGLVEQLQFRIELQDRLLRSVWKGFKPFNDVRNKWKADLDKALNGFVVSVLPEEALSHMVKRETAEFVRIISPKFCMDVAEMSATPYKFFDEIKLQREACVAEVVRNAKERKLQNELHISPLEVAIKSECYLLTFYFYALMIVRY
jgi:hypothetical protein